MIDITYNSCSTSIKDSLHKNLHKEIANIILVRGKTQTIIQLEKELNSFSRMIDNICTKIFTDLSNINTSLVIPVPQNDPSTAEVFTKYASLLLTDIAIKSIFSDDNIKSFTKICAKKIKAKLAPIETQDLDDDTEMATQKFGGFNISMKVSPVSYAMDNMQELMKMGGGKAASHRISQFLSKPKPADTHNSDNTTEQALTGFFEFIKNTIHSIAYLTQLPYLNIDESNMSQIEYQLSMISNMLGFSRKTHDVSQLAEFSILLNKVKENVVVNLADRGINPQNLLTLKDYYLESKPHLTKSKLEIKIQDLVFVPGKIYAIAGKIGTGKTTLLTDIAQCLHPAFSSSGKILYPSTDDGKNAIPMIFSGSEHYKAPGTTLFERITYRLPTDYATSHKSMLEMEITTLCQDFGNITDISTQLSKKNVKLSTGQGKMVALIGIIIYKNYLETTKHTPTLLVLDETLANLDDDTAKSVCTKIKTEFKDSIVICVQHGAKIETDSITHKNIFYDELIDLSQYRAPEVEVIGDY